MKAIVFIDGNNFYFKLKELTSNESCRVDLLSFDYQNFAKWLVATDTLTQVRYYIGAVRRKNGKDKDKSERLYANQQKLLSKLDREQVSISLGVLIQHPDKTYHEKGVDVKLAVEMIRLARINEYDVAYLLSSDTDLVAAVQEVQAFGKQVVYVGIAKGQSYGLSQVANDVRLLRAEDIKQFLVPLLDLRH